MKVVNHMGLTDLAITIRCKYTPTITKSYHRIARRYTIKRVTSSNLCEKATATVQLSKTSEDLVRTLLAGFWKS